MTANICVVSSMLSVLYSKCRVSKGVTSDITTCRTIVVVVDGVVGGSGVVFCLLSVIKKTNVHN